MPTLISIAGIQRIVQGAQFTDPRLYDALMAIIGRLQSQDIDIQSIQAQAEAAVAEAASAEVESVTIFEYSLRSDYIQLTWERPDSSIFNFEIRKGSVWETAVRVLVTNTTSAVIDPLTVGTHTYLIKSIDVNGLYSLTAKSLDIIIPPIGSISIIHDVIDNNVLLYWSNPTSAFRIIYYIVKRNGEEIGNKDGTFTTVFEQVSGTNTYSIIAVDLAGNQSPESFRDVTVSQPPDYILEDSQESTFTGTKVSCIADSNRLLCCVHTTETWSDHFVNNSYNTIQDQISAGKLIYIEPGQNSGSYLEVFDFGSILTNIIINISWATEVLDDVVTVVCKVRYSDDAISWSTQVTGTSIFAASARYVEVKLEFTGGANKLIQLFDLAVRLDVKQTTDSGTEDVLAADTGGTVVNFNKAFRDVNSIILTVRTTSNYNAVHDFVDVPDPTSFKILVFNSSGTRQDATVSWIAKGII